jgi:hypothetical protein
MTRAEKRRRDREIVRDMLSQYNVPTSRPANWNQLRPALEAAARRHGLAVPWAWREPRLRLVVKNRTHGP